MILGVKWRIIFSAHRKPNIGLAARNGEGKHPKQTAQGEKFLPNKVSIHSSNSRCKSLWG